jgi:hypothetical protein
MAAATATPIASRRGQRRGLGAGARGDGACLVVGVSVLSIRT